MPEAYDPTTVERRATAVDTAAQMTYIADLYVRLGFKYIIGLKACKGVNAAGTGPRWRGYIVQATRYAQWQDEHSTPYVNLR